MKQGSATFLQAVIVLIGIGSLAFLLWEPHVEGRNAHATLFQIYFKDPFLAFAYIASISFFVALYQAFKVLGYVKQNRIFSQVALRAFRIIRRCAISLLGFLMAAEGYFLIVVRGQDDIAGGVAMGLFLSFVFAVVAAAAALSERILQDAVNMKSETDLSA